MAIKRLTYESSLAFSPNGPYWKFIKKLTLSELVGSKGTERYWNLRAQKSRNLMKVMASKAKEVVNVTEELHKMTNKVISKMIIGESEEAIGVIREVTEVFGEFNMADFVRVMKKFDVQGFGKRIEDLFHRFDSIVEKIITKRELARKVHATSRTKQDDDRDFLDILLDIAEDPSSEVKLTRIHMKGLVMVI